MALSAAGTVVFAALAVVAGFLYRRGAWEKMRGWMLVLCAISTIAAMACLFLTAAAMLLIGGIR